MKQTVLNCCMGENLEPPPKKKSPSQPQHGMYTLCYCVYYFNKVKVVVCFKVMSCNKTSVRLKQISSLKTEIKKCCDGKKPQNQIQRQVSDSYTSILQIRHATYKDIFLPSPPGQMDLSGKKVTTPLATQPF